MTWKLNLKVPLRQLFEEVRVLYDDRHPDLRAVPVGTLQCYGGMQNRTLSMDDVGVETLVNDAYLGGVRRRSVNETHVVVADGGHVSKKRLARV